MADRPSGTAAGMPANTGAGTISGNRGLMIEEPLSFEQGMPGRTAVDMLLSRLDERAATPVARQSSTLPTHLTVRESTGPAPTKGRA